MKSAKTCMLYHAISNLLSSTPHLLCFCDVSFLYKTFSPLRPIAQSCLSIQQYDGHIFVKEDTEIQACLTSYMLVQKYYYFYFIDKRNCSLFVQSFSISKAWHKYIYILVKTFGCVPIPHSEFLIGIIGLPCTLKNDAWVVEGDVTVSGLAKWSWLISWNLNKLQGFSLKQNFPCSALSNWCMSLNTNTKIQKQTPGGIWPDLWAYSLTRVVRQIHPESGVWCTLLIWCGQLLCCAKSPALVSEASSLKLATMELGAHSHPRIHTAFDHGGDNILP